MICLGCLGLFSLVHEHVRLAEADELRHGLGHVQVLQFEPLPGGLVLVARVGVVGRGGGYMTWWQDTRG